MVGEKISAENEKHEEKNPWEKMAEDAPPFAGEAQEAEKPDKLYRGVTLTWDHFINSSYNVFEDDLYPPNAHRVDEKGRKTVGDGNEYGVYMTTNEKMVDAAYGRMALHGEGSALEHDVSLGNAVGRIREPKIFITYEIDPKKADIRRPFITQSLEGHYNNGFEGEEWIADVVPKEAYRVRSVGISGDFLHDPEAFDPDSKHLDDKITNRFEERKGHLEYFAETLLTAIPEHQRRTIGNDDKALFRDLFGDGGAVYAMPNAIKADTADGMAHYLLTVNSLNTPEKLDLRCLRTIEKYRKGLDKEASVADLVNLIQSDIDRRRQKLLEKGRNPNDTLFRDEEAILAQIRQKVSRQ